MKVPNMTGGVLLMPLSLSRLQNEGSQPSALMVAAVLKSIKATE